MQRRNSISIICSEHSFSFTDISLRYSLMHFQTSIRLFIINLRMFCLTFFYLPFISIKALCEEMLSSCLSRASLPCLFPVKRSYWHASSISSPPSRSAVQSHGHWFSLFGRLNLGERKRADSSLSTQAALWQPSSGLAAKSQQCSW